MKTITRICLKMVQHLLPDAFILAILLTFVVLWLGLVMTPNGLTDMIMYWGKGFSSMYVFGMQMVLVLITGYVLALTPIVQKFLDKITDLPKSPTQALALTSLVSILSCYISWSFGLVIGAILARHMGRKVRGLHFPLLVAAAYGGEIIRGPSSSIPLVSATPGNFMEKMGIPLTPVSETLYSSWNILMSVVIVAALVLLYYNMRSSTTEIVEFSDKESAAPNKENKLITQMTFAERLEHAYILNILFALLPLSYLIMNMKSMGFDLNLNFCIMIFLVAGLLLHTSPMGYLDAVKQAIGSSRGIILQFPLYAGMSGMMSHSGLVEMVSNWFVSISTPLLGVDGLSARDIMGYCVIWTAISGVIICGTFILLSFL